MKKIIYILIVACLVVSCSTTRVTKSERYAEIYEEKPVSILVMPPINRSTKVEAKELFYSSLVVPLSQRGYYIMPPLLTMEILKEESAYDAEMFVGSSMRRVGELFGVDAVLFTTIHEWAKTTLAAQIRVVVEYTLKSTKTDEVLFSRKGDITYTPSSNSGNSLADVLSSMLTTALTSEIEVGRKCNVYTLGDLPAGKYSPSWGADGDTPSGAQSFKAQIQ
ncbi:MAG: DUF799 domain-containing protein [Rikenellaceae bacterium]|jgi:hypothetical protein|nr:DUF799 domain-containing protein [Rikenellaceae bacterium]